MAVTAVIKYTLFFISRAECQAQYIATCYQLHETARLACCDIFLPSWSRNVSPSLESESVLQRYQVSARGSSPKHGAKFSHISII